LQTNNLVYRRLKVWDDKEFLHPTKIFFLEFQEHIKVKSGDQTRQKLQERGYSLKTQTSVLKCTHVRSRPAKKAKLTVFLKKLVLKQCL